MRRTHEEAPRRDLQELIEWLRTLPGSSTEWVLSVRAPDHLALFANCRDSEVPYSIHASAVAIGLLGPRAAAGNPDGFRYDVGLIRDCQDERTGLFIDPHLDARLPGRGRPEVLIPFRHAVSKYALGFLRQAGAEPRYPYSPVGETGEADPSAYLAYLEAADWANPWGTGSHAGLKTVEIFKLLNQGRTELAAPLERGLAMILQRQNPRTGMWGDDTVPLHVQMSGALKVNGRLFWGMGVEVPRMDRLADSLLSGWASGELGPAQGVLIPRNVGELAAMCLEHAPYRLEELRGLIEEVLACLRSYQVPDGAFASGADPCAPIGWCGSPIAGRATSPRSDMVGLQAVRYTVGLLAPYVGWEDCPWPSPFAGWRERLDSLSWRVEIEAPGAPRVVRRS